MTTKIKMVASLLDANIVPVRYDGKEIGVCFIHEDELMVVVDKQEQEFRKAFSKPGLSGFSLEINHS